MNMIVKNEMANLERCLSAVADHISCWVICDTGSSDGTQDFIRTFFARRNLPGELHTIPFHDFGQARNEALDRTCASKLDFDYVLFNDADMEFIVDDAKFRQSLAGPGYRLLQRASGGLSYWNTRLVRRDTGSRYIGVTHEYIDVPGDVVELQGAWYIDHASGANRGDKSERDIRLLEAALEREPDNARYWFYLAWSYRDAGQYAKSAATFAKRAEMEGWDEEAWMAQLQHARCLRDMGDEDAFVSKALEAFKQRPTRAEPLYDLARYYRECGRHETSLHFSELGLSIPAPESDILFIETDVYQTGLHEEFSIAANYSQDAARWDRGYSICNGLALNRAIPDDPRELARANLFFYLQSAQQLFESFSAQPVQYDVPTGYRPTNPSVSRHGDDLYLVQRAVNFRLLEDGTYETDSGDPIRTRNFLLRLDTNLGVQTSAEILPPADFPIAQFEEVQGLEDIRLFSWNGSLWGSSCVRELNAEGWCEQLIARIEQRSSSETRLADWRVLRPEGPRLHEKNWMPQANGTSLRFVYSCGPTKIVNDRGELVSESDAAFAVEQFRGGTPLIEFDQGWLALVHEVQWQNDRRFYQHRFVWFDRDNRLRRLSRPFFFKDKGVEFAAGLAWHPDGRRLLVSYGVADSESWIASIDATEVRSTLESDPVSRPKASAVSPPLPSENTPRSEQHVAKELGLPQRVGKSIGLCMIVKNEAAVIDRCLDSVRQLIDYVLIEDTGSTDGTQEVIRQWLDRNGLAGEVVDEPWRDFAYNRSHALACLRRRPDVDYAFIIDADDALTIEPGFDVAGFKSGMSADLYDVAINHNGIRHYRPHICSNKKEFYFRGVLHEFVEAPADAHGRETAPGFAIQIGGGGARSQDPLKYRKDAALLERALQSETDAFLRSRYTFYLAQSYRDCNEPEKALPHYLARAEMGFWQEEVFISLYSAARLKEALAYPEDDVIAAYQRATDAQPQRAEALHGASRYCRSKSRNKQGADIARGGIDLPIPIGALFVEEWIYEFGLLDEFAVNAYWSADYEGCIDACLRILQIPSIDEGVKRRVEDNLRFAKDRISERVRLADAHRQPGAADPLPKVLIAILAKSKAGHLPLYLECIEALDYPPDRIAVHVRTNNNQDDTANILRDWLKRVGRRYSHVELDDSDAAERVEEFADHEWNATRFSVLGRIRQHSMNRTLVLGCDYYLVVDVDNYLRPSTLRSLVDLNRPIVAPLLKCVDEDRPLYSNYHQKIDANGYFLPSDEYNNILGRSSPGLYEVPVVHCTYLVRADAIPHLTYDDGSGRYEYVIFSHSARRAGISQTLDTREIYGWLTFASDGEAIRPLVAGEFAAKLSQETQSKETVPASNGKRTIRLKEYPANVSLSHTPSDEYVESRKHTLVRKPYLMETDALGFIRGSQSPATAARTVIVLGDSVVEGMYLDPDDRFCAKLETILRSESALDVIVRNGGYSGATTLHMLNLFLNKIIPLKPDVVILMTGIVDVDVAGLEASFWSRDCWLEPIVDLNTNNSWRDQNLLSVPSVADRRRLLDLFSLAARSFGIELWFATIPHLRGERIDPAVARTRALVNETTRAAARAGKHILCDLEARLAGRTDIFQDAFHLNPVGAEAAARSIVSDGLGTFLLAKGANTQPRAAQGNRQSTNDIHVINLDRSAARWDKFKSRNAKLSNVERVSAIDGSKLDRSRLEREGLIAPGLDYSAGALGCALSHINLWQKAASQDQPLTIFEDDALSHPAFDEHRLSVLAQMPSDWDIILWGFIYDPLYLWIDLGFSASELRFYDRSEPFSWSDTPDGPPTYRPYRLRHAYGIQAYSISPRGARRFLGSVLPLKKQLVPFPGTPIVDEDQGIDGAMNLAYPTMQSYVCIPPLVVQRDDGVSDRLSTK
ncbi:GR25 family glycosyltransferase involved in LPS biosynthesis/glycosyltransferase involved in cell wall biosynthesis/lysophospholipase L1-like esterase [Bradyrhizobium sp. USDA 3240]